MQFIKAKSPSEGIMKFAESIVFHLAEGKKVLWLIPGGSNIPISVEIMNMVREDMSSKEISNLTVALSDERFGPVGHEDSNWQQLKENGFVFEGLENIPVLHGMPLADTIRNYNEKIGNVITKADFIVGQFGIGADGHISGIMPRSLATTSTDIACAYESNPYTRITLTFPAFRKVHAGFTFAFGPAKKKPLERLQKANESLADLPSMILYEIPQCYLYSDQC